MFLTNFKRVFQSGFVNFWRNGFVSLSSISIMTVTLFTVGLMIFGNAVLNASLNYLRDRVDINVYFMTTANESDILAYKKSIEALPETKNVEYISREKVLSGFTKRHEDDHLTVQALDEIGTNPFGAVLNIRAKDVSQYEGIAKFLDEKNSADQNGGIITKIDYNQNKVAIDALTKIIYSTRKVAEIIIGLFMALSMLITFNTIRLVIYTSREEISVMKLVGATSAYTRGPFIVAGAMYGSVSAILALILLYPFASWIGPTTSNFFNGVNIASYYTSNFFQMFVIIFGFGILLGVVSSYLAIRRYLSV